jgi:HTH-type transcriptional regulator/antitoxin HipB
MDQASRTQKQLAAEIRRYRKNGGLTQAHVAGLIDKRQATISSLESEGRGTIETLFAVLSALNLELTVRPRSKSERAKLGDIF